MSAEAADRVAAAIGSRPGTPLQTSWFEFLLDVSLLEKHLQKSNPDPTPVQLIIQFLEQASKPSVNEQNQVQPPVDNRRNRTLKLLALKVAAHMKWDLDLLEKGLTIPVLNMLLNELLCVSKVPPGVKHVDLDLSTLPPTTAMAVIIYNRWESSLDEVCHKLCVCNAIRDALEGEVLGVRFQQLLLKPSKRMVDFILEVCTRSLEKDRPAETSRRNMAIFMNPCLLFTTFQVGAEFSLTPHVRLGAASSAGSGLRPSSASASVNIGQLEQQLILLLEPRRIRQILIELHGMAERPFWRVNSKWEVPPDYINVILGIKDNLTKDLVYILMAKGLHCISIKDFAHARQLFSACLELVTEFSPKLRQVMLNEMLLLEVRAHESMAAEGSKERPPPDLVSRVRGYLEMRIHDLPLRQVVGEECVAFMLNWRENDYLTLQVPPSLVMNNPYIKLGQLLASTCKELPGPKESRRTAKELWDVVVQICSVSIQHKRNSDGRVGLIKHRESSMGLFFFPPLQDDIVNEVTAEHLSIWPSSLPNIQAVDVEAVAVTVKELVSYALTLNPNNQSWLITQADIYFVTNQYSAALNLYLQAGAVCSDFFTKAVSPDVYTDQVLKRMIKCCSMMNCHTQVAVLCQFLREVDYMTAFKALQEPNSHDAMDSFYDYIWDVTILEYLTHIHHKRGETEKRQIAIKAIGQTELNTSNPEEVLQLAAQKRKKRFLQAMAKLYF
uniref:INTS8 TPR repeats domain-containing protein n=1 Tax=Salarias fasciatus TaxID=181472 RepID=A0A672GWB2_SALFA